MKPPPCAVDRWAAGSLTRRRKYSFAIFWPRQFEEVITLEEVITSETLYFFNFLHLTSFFSGKDPEVQFYYILCIIGNGRGWGEVRRWYAAEQRRENLDHDERVRHMD